MAKEVDDHNQAIWSVWMLEADLNGVFNGPPRVAAPSDLWMCLGQIRKLFWSGAILDGLVELLHASQLGSGFDTF
jgi:hypothetical protein